MIDKYITSRQFASLINIPEKKIDIAISNLNSKEKDFYLDKEKNILLNQDSLDKVTSILVKEINDTQIIIPSKITCGFEWDRDRPNDMFWAQPIKLNLDLSKLFYEGIYNRLITDGYNEREVSWFGFYLLEKKFVSSSDLLLEVKRIIDYGDLYDNSIGDFDTNHFGDNSFRSYRSRLVFDSHFITAMTYHERSKRRYGYRPKKD